MTISMVVLFGLILAVCIFKDNMGKFHAFVAVMFGLFLGTTDAGPGIMQGVQDFIGWLGEFKF